VTQPDVAGDVRLDNRDELLRTLAVEPEARAGLTDLALAGRAYARWGRDCPNRLLGDFAFVVIDRSTGRAFGARDPLGVKPFYYRATERRLSFATRASGIGDVDEAPMALDEARVADACVPALECIDHVSTFFHGVYRLPPGHRLTFAAGRATIEPYWTPGDAPEIRFASDRDYVEAFRELFAAAVRSRLDTDSAAMLSGGVDSSTIAGFARELVAREQDRRLTTLSAVTDDPGCEETRHVRAFQALPALDPVSIRPADLASFRNDILEFATAMEEPFDDAMLLPLVIYAAARRRGFRGVLDGLDGDIVASQEPDVLDGMWRRGRWRVALRDGRAIADFYRDTYAPWSTTARVVFASAARGFAPAWLRAAALPFRQRRGVRAALADSIVGPELAARVGVESRLKALWSHRAGDTSSGPRARHARELTHPQLAAALERYHRVAASAGIEARHPFLDRRLVEFCLGIPWEQRLHRGWSKWIVRRAAEGLVPDEVRFRRGRWVRLGATFMAAALSESGTFVSSELAGDLDELAPYVDRPKVRDLYRRYAKGDPSAAEPVWRAAVLSRWLRNSRSRRYDGGARANGPAALPVAPLAG